jgi:hypothetical protein
MTEEEASVRLPSYITKCVDITDTNRHGLVEVLYELHAQTVTCLDIF